jgi:hypothetical protein
VNWRRYAHIAVLPFATAISSLTHAQPQLAVDGTEFVVTVPDGRTLRSADLVGATLKIGAGGKSLEVTIASVEEDRRATVGRVVLHRFLVRDETGRPKDLCTPDAERRHHGFPVPDGRGGFDLTCTSGAVGKCIRWGYRPWEEEPGGPPLRALHKACVHMARADYGGDGGTSTRDGTIIGMQDRFGIRRFDQRLPMRFEAAWGVNGAVCVARPRIVRKVSLEQLTARYPGLAKRVGARACTFESAMRDPAALLFNWSHGQ